MSFVVAGNWKMNKSPQETTQFFEEFLTDQNLENIDCLFFVPSVNAQATSIALENSPISWGPQNIFPAASGAFTGETSPKVMADLGANYILIGHSERRTLFHESDTQTNIKLHCANDFGLNAVLCVGETLSERKEGATLDVLNRQLIAALSNFQPKNTLHIAYEPVWAIGTGEVATTDQVSEAHQFIRQFISEKLPQTHENIKILYGGSVKPENAKELSQAKEVGGFLVGGASLKADSFLEIIKAVS